MNTRNGRTLATIAVAISVAACGGGGGSNGSAPPAPGAPATATVTVTPDSLPDWPPSVGAASWVGEAFTLQAGGKVASTNLAAGNAVYLRVQDMGDTLSTPAPQPVSPNGPFTVTLGPKRELAVGSHIGTIEYTACRDARCDAVYGPPVSVKYEINVLSLGDWNGIQRDSSHNGFVPTLIDPARLEMRWEWRPPAASAAGGGVFVTRPATSSDVVLVLAGTADPSGAQRDVALHAIDESSGKPKWAYAIPDGTYAQAPVTGITVNRQVILQTLNSPTLITSLDAQDGSVLFTAGTGEGISARTLAPTTFGGSTFYYAGTNGGEIHALENYTGKLRWTSPRPARQPGTPTVRNASALYPSRVYFQNGRTIEILDTWTGTPYGTITDPSSDGADSPFLRPVMAIGSRDNVVAVSYNGATGASPLSSFNIDGRRWEWSTTHSYRSFAVSDGVVFSYREGASAATLDAIDEATGQVQWSWTPPTEDAQVRTVGNVMLTRNLAFVSTEGNSGSSFVWAIDRATHQPVWRHPDGGYVVMSGGRTLYVLSGPGNGKPGELLRAFRMK